jgi:hypothetical protein
MSYFKVEILLPLYHNPDKGGKREKISNSEFSDTYKDLVTQFGGCTINPIPQSGGWINPETGEQITDELTVYWVVFEDSKENESYLRNFKEILKKRFKQDDIMMFSMPITKF